MKHIKNKLENYELPYDEGSWKKLNRKLNKPKRLITYSMVSIFVILFGFSYFTTSTIPTAQTLSEKTETIHVTRNVVDTEISKELIIETYSLPEEEYDDVLLAYNEETIPVIEIEVVEFEEEIEENINYLKGGDNNLNDNYDEAEINVDSIARSKAKTTIKPIYYAPTAFSPNSDGSNDEFYIVSEYLDNFKFHIVIYDRWGFAVFETTDSKLRWDGKDCREGSYYWILTLEDSDGVRTLDSGSLTLIK